MAQLDTVADYILFVAHGAGQPITNLKLQKIVYYTQAWSLALRGEPMFEESIEAWVHGPVVLNLYHRFKGFGSLPIEWGPEEEPEALEDAEKKLLDDVLEVYLGFSSWDLERLTHAEEPWIEARGDLPPTEPSATEISRETMARFYLARSKEAEAAEAVDKLGKYFKLFTDKHEHTGPNGAPLPNTITVRLIKPEGEDGE